MKKNIVTQEVDPTCDLTEFSFSKTLDLLVEKVKGKVGIFYLSVSSQNLLLAAKISGLISYPDLYVKLNTDYDVDEWSVDFSYFDLGENNESYNTISYHSNGV